VITDDRPGTTRDSIDSHLLWEGTDFCLIDTAGLRKRSHVNEAIESMSAQHTEQSVQRCDVALVLVDAGQGIEEQDIKIIQSVIDRGKGLCVGINKWDLKEKEDKTLDHMVKAMREYYPCLRSVPILSISAKTGQRVQKVLETAREINAQLDLHYAPQDLKDFLVNATERHHHPSMAGRKVIFHSIFQVSVRPPVFEIKTNHPRDIRETYLRYLDTKFHERFGGYGVPVTFKFSKKAR
jgi:GTP-binding protein